MNFIYSFHKLILQARQQNSNENVEVCVDNLLEPAENANPDPDFCFKEEIAKD